MSYSIKKFYLGEGDGKREAAHRNDFDRFFYNYDGTYDEITNSNRFLVLGKKGTGKTILAEYIKKTKSRSSLNFCELISFADFQLKQIKELRNQKDASPNEYIPIWTWIIYLELAKLILQDNGVADMESKEKLETFFKENFDSIDIATHKIIEITERKEASGSFKWFGFSKGKEVKKGSGEYYQYLDSLIDVVKKCMVSSSSKFLLLLDELDYRFKNNSNYYDNIISLLKATDKANLDFLKNRIKTKIVIFLRTDIFNLLNDPELNKIRTGGAVFIDWGNKVERDSPLFKLVFSKIRQSVPELSDYDDDSLFDVLFPQPINEKPPEKFILERTLFRPRDLITYLNLIMKKYPQTQYFGGKGFLEAEPDYSIKYFFQEARDELSGHLSAETIEEGFALIKKIHNRKFSYKDIQEQLQKNRSFFKNLDLNEFLKTLFKFGLIGNIRESNGKSYQSWSYREELATLDMNQTIVVHRGLKKAFF